MLKALILDGDTRAGLETAQSLARRGIEVHVASPGDCLAFHSRRLRVRLLQPDNPRSEEFLAWLRALHAEHQYALIVPAAEFSLLHLIELTEDDSLRVRAVLPSTHALRIALDKSLTLERARTLAIPVPASVLITRPQDLPATNYPVVLKPLHSKVAVDGQWKRLAPAFAAHERERVLLLESLLPFTPVLQQEYVPGRGWGIELLYCRGRKLWHFCHERLHEGEGLMGGGSAYRRSAHPPAELLRQAEALLDSLSWHGVAMVEFRVAQDGRHWLMEINPRLWGSLALAIDAGVDFPYGLLCLATGEQVPPQPVYRVPYYTRALDDDLAWMRHRAAEAGPLALLPELPGWARPLLGRESWDHFDWGDLSVSAAQVRVAAAKTWEVVTQGRRRRRAAKAALAQHRQLVERLPALHIRNLLFVCYGNICRSPLAEALARTLLPGMTPETKVASAGFYPVEQRLTPGNVQRAARALGVDLSHCSSRRVTAAMVTSADLILLFDLQNYTDFAREFPAFRGKADMLGLWLEPSQLEIQDPYGESPARTAEIASQISSALSGLRRHLSAANPADVAETALPPPTAPVSQTSSSSGAL